MLFICDICSKSEGDTKGAEMNRRKLSADMAVTRSRLHLKQREGMCCLHHA